jgi:cell division protein DivIC
MARVRRSRGSTFLRVIALIFVAYMIFTALNLRTQITLKRKELEDILLQCEEQRISNQEMERILAIEDEDSYIERIAKEKLGFAYPDEHILIDVSGSN